MPDFKRRRILMRDRSGSWESALLETFSRSWASSPPGRNFVEEESIWKPERARPAFFGPLSSMLESSRH